MANDAPTDPPARASTIKAFLNMNTLIKKSNDGEKHDRKGVGNNHQLAFRYVRSVRYYVLEIMECISQRL